MRTVKVTGKGQIKVKPDTTRITMILEGEHKDYGDTLKFSAQDTEQLKDILSVYGFERSDLKTLSFNIDTEHESYRENNVYKRRFVGYKFRHILKVEFDSDNERLGKILYALANCPLRPEFRISYTVKDPETAKNELLAKAVSDAKEKSAVLSQAAGVKLKDIQSIDYSWGKINFEFDPMDENLMEDVCMSLTSDVDKYDIDIEPDDIEVSDTVTVVWEIE